MYALSLFVQYRRGQNGGQKSGQPEGQPPNHQSALSSSGNPATLVSSDRIPASSAELPTMIQLTSPMTADVPMVAMAACATVLIAWTPAALIHSFRCYRCGVRAPAATSHCPSCVSYRHSSRLPFLLSCASSQCCWAFESTGIRRDISERVEADQDGPVLHSCAAHFSAYIPQKTVKLRCIWFGFTLPAPGSPAGRWSRPHDAPRP